jgi:ParB-like chromosome segregation protein Spo0J
MRIVQINELTIHPLADLLLQMPENEYLHFRDDIKASGLKEDIWVLNGQVVDGRHRYRACRELGIEPTFRELPPETYEQTIVGLVSPLNV